MLYYPDMPTLHLTGAEQKLFHTLPQELRDGVTIETETITFEDSAEKREIRMRNLQVKDEGLHAIRGHIGSMKTAEDLIKLAQTFDFGSLSKDDLIELYFAMGPHPLTATIELMIPEMKTPEDLEELASLTFIRHGVVSVLN